MVALGRPATTTAVSYPRPLPVGSATGESMLTAETRTHPGGRATNEDCVLWDPDLALMAIADGMGGHNAGEVASRVALETARDFLRKSADIAESETTTATWAFGIRPDLSLTANRLLNAAKLAN